MTPRKVPMARECVRKKANPRAIDCYDLATAGNRIAASDLSAFDVGRLCPICKRYYFVVCTEEAE